MPACYFHNDSHIEHSEQSAHTNDIPLPCSEKHIAESHGENHQRAVNNNLYLREVDACHAAHRHRETLARHCHRAASHLKGDADAQDGASRNLRQCLLRYAVGQKPRCESHIQVDE